MRRLAYGLQAIRPMAPSDSSRGVFHEVSRGVSGDTVGTDRPQTSSLELYLHHHAAEVTRGVELARRLHDQDPSSSDQPILQQVAQDLEDDRQMLRTVLSALAFRQYAYIKETLSWVSARLDQLQVGATWLEEPSLRCLLDLEALRASVSAKVQLWSALRAIQKTEPGLRGFDFEEMLDRAVQQEHRVASLHELTVKECFESPSAK